MRHRAEALAQGHAEVAQEGGRRLRGQADGAGEVVPELGDREVHGGRDQGGQAALLELGGGSAAHLDGDDAVGGYGQVGAVGLGGAHGDESQGTVLHRLLDLGPGHLGHQHVLSHDPREGYVLLRSFPACYRGWVGSRTVLRWAFYTRSRIAPPPVAAAATLPARPAPGTDTRAVSPPRLRIEEGDATPGTTATSRQSWPQFRAPGLRSLCDERTGRLAPPSSARRKPAAGRRTGFAGRHAPPGRCGR